VRTRDGFYGAPDESGEPAKTENPLMEAIFSPFRNNDLKLIMAAGFVAESQSGFLIRAWLHLDGLRLGTIAGKDKSQSVSIEAVAVTTDSFGSIQDSGTSKIEFRVNDREFNRYGPTASGSFFRLRQNTRGRAICACGQGPGVGGNRIGISVYGNA